MLVALVDVAPGGVRLPHLDELVGDGAPPRVEEPAGDRHPLALRLARVLQRQIGLDGRDVALPEGRRVQLDRLGIDETQILRRMPQQARAVRREVVQAAADPLARGLAAKGVGVHVLDLLRDRRLRHLDGRREQRLRAPPRSAWVRSWCPLRQIDSDPPGLWGAVVEKIVTGPARGIRPHSHSVGLRAGLRPAPLREEIPAREDEFRGSAPPNARSPPRTRAGALRHPQRPRELLRVCTTRRAEPALVRVLEAHDRADRDRAGVPRCARAGPRPRRCRASSPHASSRSRAPVARTSSARSSASDVIECVVSRSSGTEK